MNPDLTKLKELLKVLAQRIPELERQRSMTPFANDIFEAASYWRDIGAYVFQGNTKVNYPATARSEIGEMAKLKAILSGRSREDQDHYAPILRLAEQILRSVERVEPPSEGHLGILRILREQFAFLETDYGFRVTDERPIGLRYSSGAVYVELQWAKKYSSSSCSFGAESNPKSSFWIEDLLFMYGDRRYRTLPEDLGLDTEEDVERWFTFLSGIFRQYGHDVLTNRPGIFEELAKAQEQRGREYTQEMDRLYGGRVEHP